MIRKEFQPAKKVIAFLAGFLCLWVLGFFSAFLVKLAIH